MGDSMNENTVSSPVFRGITPEEMQEIQNGSYARAVHYAKNEPVFYTGDVVTELGIVQNGNVHIETIDFWGNKSILSSIAKGQVFAETYAYCGEPLMVDVTATKDTDILFISMNLLKDTKNAGKSWHIKLMNNMLFISLQKNLTLSGRIFCTTPKTIRGRLLTYLSQQAAKNDSARFQIPFNRQQMADYLNLDRSALSKELGRMREEGILDFHKNEFRLIESQTEDLWN